MKLFYSIAWLLWGIYFLVVEFMALLSHHSEFTLSEFIWRFEGHNGMASISHFIILVILVWLVGHLGFHLWYQVQ